MNRTATLASCLLAACSATIDPSQIHCRDNSECGTGSYCTPSGTCATTPVDCPLPSVKIGDACKYPPAAPTGVTATSSANVSLQWSTAADAASWVVQRAAAAAGPFSLEFAATTNSYVDTTVAPGTAVWYQIVAVDTSNIRSAPSAVVAGLTLPAAPQGLTATGQLNSVHLSSTPAARAHTHTLPPRPPRRAAPPPPALP